MELKPERELKTISKGARAVIKKGPRRQEVGRNDNDVVAKAGGTGKKGRKNVAGEKTAARRRKQKQQQQQLWLDFSPPNS